MHDRPGVSFNPFAPRRRPTGNGRGVGAFSRKKKTMSRAWTFQDSRQKKKLGDKCPWSVGYIDPDGAKRSKRIGSKSMAEKFRRKIEGQLAAGVYQDTNRKQWADFQQEYEEKILSGLAPGSRESSLIALKHFKRIAKPKRIDAIATAMIDGFIASRRKERGAKKCSVVSPATVNKELRHIKAALRVAHEWKYLPEVPKVRMLKEPVKIPRYVTPEHFAAIYKACNKAVRPKHDHYSSGDWWQALITFAYMTGWRISEPLALKWDDVSLDTGRATTRHQDNKGSRDDVTLLHPVVVDHLRKLVDFGPLVFYWPHHRRTLWEEFTSIQEEAGIHLPCPEDHEHNRYCHVYGFHDLRRAFATLNAATMTADALQRLMRHKSYTTTQRYINLADQVNQAVENLHVPDVLKRAED